LDGSTPTEHADAVWLQAERTYAGLRIPRYGYGDLVAPVSSAGTTTWADPYLRWSCDVDLDGDAAGAAGGDGDVWHVAWRGDDLVATSALVAAGRTVTSTEVWRRLPGSGVVHACRWSPDGTSVMVRAGDHALTIADERATGGAYRACYRARHEGCWSVALALGAGAKDLPAPDASPDVSHDAIAS
jgi:hypothetical protein